VTTFLLHGRHAELVNIAGMAPRWATSIISERHPGGCGGVFLRRAGQRGSHRPPRAMVVAHGLTPDALPRRCARASTRLSAASLLFVDGLPRSAAGKLPRQAAQDLLATLQARVRDRVPA